MNVSFKHKQGFMTTLWLTLLMLVAWSSPSQAQHNPVVVLDTSLGQIEVELMPDKAPKTVANFLNYVKRGSYDNSLFHRVIPGFVAQGGGFNADFEQISTDLPIHNESNNDLSNRIGSIAMARTQAPHSATSQFYFNLGSNPQLDYQGTGRWGYTVFGQVNKGIGILRYLNQIKTGSGGPFNSDVPEQAVIIKRAFVLKSPAPTQETTTRQ